MLSLAPPEVSEPALAEVRELGELDEDDVEQAYNILEGGYLFHLAQKRGHEKGHEAGREEGREEGRQSGQLEVLRRVLVDVLELRGFVVSEVDRTSVQARVKACEQVETLERWYAAARQLAPHTPLSQIFE